jgi:hypothetical protein
MITIRFDRKTLIMNRKTAAITLTGLLAACPLFASAVGQTADESAAPPTALPGVNQAGKAQSNADKADKKGEEASGSNSGAESHETAKDAATSSDSGDLGKTPKP